jgi:tetratricopeptide (TPR) repeat protein
MDKFPTTFFRYGIAVICAGLFCHSVSAENPDELISQGWAEYQFLSLDLSESYFREALEMKLSPEMRQEATIGLAMSLQYPESGRNLQKAEELYQEVLAEEPEGEIHDLVLSNLADLHISRGEEEEALTYLNQLIETRLDTVIGQEALRRRIFLQQGAFGSDSSKKVADEAAALVEGIEGSREDPKLLPILHAQIGTLYFWLEEYEVAARHFELFSLIGSADTTSYGSQATNLYRLAQLYEEKLEDPAKAATYYARLVKEYPNSNMSYYALEKAAAAGTITRMEVIDLNLSGMTNEILNELFVPEQGGNS